MAQAHGTRRLARLVRQETRKQARKQAEKVENDLADVIAVDPIRLDLQERHTVLEEADVYFLDSTPNLEVGDQVLVSKVGEEFVVAGKAQAAPGSGSSGDWQPHSTILDSFAGLSPALGRMPYFTDGAGAMGTLLRDTDPDMTADSDLRIPTQKAVRQHVADVVAAGAPDASASVKGITKLSRAPASPTNPIALGANEIGQSGGVQGWDADLDTLAGMSSANAAALAAMTATGRASVQAADQAAGRSAIDAQQHDAQLDGLAALTGAAGKMPRFTGASAMDLVTLDPDVDLAGVAASDDAIATQQAIREYINDGLIVDIKKEFGVVGPGTEETDALQAAFAEIQAGNIKGLTFPGPESTSYLTEETLELVDVRGFFLLGSGISPSSGWPNCRIQKAGTSTSTDAGVLSLASCTNYEIEELDFIISGSTGASAAVTLWAKDVNWNGSGTGLSCLFGKFKSCVIRRISTTPEFGAAALNIRDTVSPEFERVIFPQAKVAVRLGEDNGVNPGTYGNGHVALPKFKQCDFYGDIERRNVSAAIFEQPFHDIRTALPVRNGNTHTNTTVDGLSSTSDIAADLAEFGEVYVSGTGIPGGTTVDSVDSGTAITLSAAATGTATVSLTFSPKVPAVFTVSGDARTRSENIVSPFCQPGALNEGRVYYTQGDDSLSHGLEAVGGMISEVAVAFDIKAVAGNAHIGGGVRFDMPNAGDIAVRIGSAVTGQVELGAHDPSLMVGAGAKVVEDNRTTYPTYAAGSIKDGSIVARRSVDDDFLRLLGGDSPASSPANLILYGGTHATQARRAYLGADQFIIRNPANAAEVWMNLADDASFKVPAVYAATTTSRPNTNVGSDGQLKRSIAGARVVYAEDHGVTGDGSNQTSAMNAAIAALQALGTNTKRVLVLPAGDIQVTSALDPLSGSNWRVKGAGRGQTRVYGTHNGAVFTVDVSSASSYFTRFDDLAIEASISGTYSSSVAILISASTGSVTGLNYCHFRNVQFRDIYRGIYFEDTGKITWNGRSSLSAHGFCIFENLNVPVESGSNPVVYTIDCEGAAPQISEMHGGHVRGYNNNATPTSGAPVKLGSGTSDHSVGDWIFNGVHFVKGYNAVELHGPSNGGTAVTDTNVAYNQNVIVTGCQLDNCTNATIWADHMLNCRFGPNNSTTSVGMALTNCNDIFQADRNAFTFPGAFTINSGSTSPIIIASSGVRYGQTAVARQTADDRGSIIFGGSGTTGVSRGAFLELYGKDHATVPDQAFLNGARLRIRSQDQANTYLDLQGTTHFKVQAAYDQTASAGVAPNVQVASDGQFKRTSFVPASAQALLGVLAITPFGTYSGYTAVDDQILIVRCVPDENQTVDQMTFGVVTASTNNDQCQVGIYSSAGSLLASSSATSGKLNVAGNSIVDLSSSYALVAGTVYYFALWTEFTSGTAAVIGGNTIGTVRMSAFWGSSMPNMYHGLATGASLPSTISPTVTGATTAPVLGAIEA
jgi:hypothetical protein